MALVSYYLPLCSPARSAISDADGRARQHRRRDKFRQFDFRRRRRSRQQPETGGGGFAGSNDSIQVTVQPIAPNKLWLQERVFGSSFLGSRQSNYIDISGGPSTQWCRFLSQEVREKQPAFVALPRARFPPLYLARHEIPDSSEISTIEYVVQFT